MTVIVMALVWTGLAAVGGVSYAPAVEDIAHQMDEADQTHQMPATDEGGENLGRDFSDLPPGAGRIIGSPDPGPEPRQSGDRGGWRQLVLMAALAGAVTFIMVQILRSTRRRDRPHLAR